MDLELPEISTNHFNQEYTHPVMEKIVIKDSSFLNEHERNKFEMFEGYEYDPSNEIYHGDSNSVQAISTLDKPYFRKLDSILEIPEEVKNLVREKIITSNRRIHVISDETLCTYVISSYQELGIIFDLQHITNLFSIDLRKTNIFGFLSKATTKDNPTMDNPTSINFILIKPSSVIKQVFEEYKSKYSIVFENKPLLDEKLYLFMKMIEESVPIINQYSAKETASATIYLYLIDKMKHVKKSLFSKKIFSSLSGVSDRGFIICHDIIKKFIIKITEQCPSFFDQFY
jgi:hypothetical protein